MPGERIPSAPHPDTPTCGPERGESAVSARARAGPAPVHGLPDLHLQGAGVAGAGQRPAARAVQRGPDELGAEATVLVEERGIRRPAGHPDPAPGAVAGLGPREDAETVPGRAAMPAHEALRKGVADRAVGEMRLESA